MSGPTCPGFMPHGVRPTRCRRCFRDLSEHKLDAKDKAPASRRKQEEKESPSVVLSLPRRRRETETAGRTRSEILKAAGHSLDNSEQGQSVRTFNSTGRRSRSRSSSNDGQAKVNKESEESDVTDSTSSDEAILERSEPDGASEKTEENETEAQKAKRIKIIAAKEVDKQLSALSDNTVENTSPDVEFILHVKTSVKSKTDGDSESVAATENTETTETTLVFQDSIEDLQSTIASQKKQIESLEEKCTRLEKEKKDILQRRMVSEADKRSLEKTASELLKLRTKVNELETNNEELKDENKSLKIEVKEVKNELKKRETPEQVATKVNGLTEKLHQAETLCEDLMEENEEIKKEVRKLEEELEELHDNFREDQASEFRELKREIEAISKNCRVLQFKLRKSEKKCEQMELEKNEAENRLKEMQATAVIDVDKTKMKTLENELKVAKEVYVKMQDELEILKETNKKLENENENLRTQGKGSRRSLSPMPEMMKTKDPGTPSNESLLRDLYDAMERENDLREQLNFAEDESKVIRRKLSTLEQENEILMMQLKKMTTTKQTKLTNNEDKEEMSLEELKLHLDLSEQEMSVLRRKVDELEQENDNLQSEIKYLQNKLVNQPMANIKLPDAPTEKSSPSSYFEHKMKLLEYEARELRKKLIDKDKENERLQTEVQVYRRKASKVIVRSRSLDSDSQVDLKRQLQLIEQEAAMLRQKTTDLDNENEKLMTENKRLQLRISRKPPLDSAGELQVENLELKTKISTLEKKLSAAQEELEKALSGGFSPTTIIAEFKPRRASLTESENELITSLKKKLKSEEDENSSLKTKLVQLEIDNNKMTRDYKKLKDALNYKKKTPKVMHDTVTRMELREIVSDLQDEINDLQITLRGREAFQETIEEEVEKYKRELISLQKDFEYKESRLTSENENKQKELEDLRKEFLNEKNKSEKLQQKLKELASSKGTELETLTNIDTLKAEHKELTQKVNKLEKSLKTKENHCHEIQEKLDSATTSKKEILNENKQLNSKLTELDKEISKHKQLLSSSEEKLRVMQTSLDSKNEELKTLRKECNNLRSQVDEERVHLKIVDDRQTEISGTWVKERNNLRRQLNEIREENINLKEKLEIQERDWQEKIEKTKQECEKKNETSVKEIKEKMKTEIKNLEEQQKISKNLISELTEKLQKKDDVLKNTVDKNRNLNSQFRKERDEWQAELAEAENKLRAEIKRKERIERELEQIKYQRDEELLSTRDRIVQLEREQRRAQVQGTQLQEKEEEVQQLTKDIEKIRSEYDDLTTRYEHLEKDFVEVKSRFVTEKEQLQNKYSTVKRDYDKVSSELKTFRETYNNRYESLLKEKSELQDRVKELQAKAAKYSSWDQEKRRMKDTIEEKDSLIESYRKEERHLKDERERLRKRLEEISKKLADAERAEKTSRSLSVIGRSDSMREDYKAELAALKGDYEGRMTMMNSEMQNMQTQIISLARERDQLKEKLTSSETKTKEVLSGSIRREKMMEMAKMLSDEERLKLEDINEQLDDVLLENKSLKLQYETDKNSWEIETAELQSRINQLEEQKLLESARGSSRTYARTRLELAWEKERAEQQRLLSEAQHVMSDLKSKLINVEKQRDKEKRDAKKRFHDLKNAIEKEHRDIKKKMAQLHGESVDARTSYEKLRTQYEWLRQDKEAVEKNQEKWKQQLIVSQDVQNQIKNMENDIKRLTALIKFDSTPEAVSSLERRKSYSRLTLNQSNLDEASKVADMLKKKLEQIQTITITIPEDDAAKRSSVRRAISVQDVGPKFGRTPQKLTNYPTPPPSMIIRPPPRQKSLNRKSLSLDYTVGMPDSHKIWESGDESNLSSPSGSQLSLKFNLGRFSAHGYESDTSLPESEYTYSSRTSRSVLGYDESTRYQTELPSREGSTFGSIESVDTDSKSKKSTLKDKLKMLRTQSLDVMKPNMDTVSLSSSKTEKEEKEKSLRSRISKVLKNSLGRSSSVETNQSTAEKTNDMALRNTKLNARS
ncbi:putative leucine-rich repeat-containing protein DDB_G0290503 isoform X2 [Centruroides vittatus]|uniref:putative leucine-rich repeat-containing protein DDB_G0290503 isoform X2 n=1 Tax=Centruroides vittatus TaxID=120091 RepID=UPI00350EF598